AGPPADRGGGETRGLDAALESASPSPPSPSFFVGPTLHTPQSKRLRRRRPPSARPRSSPPRFPASHIARRPTTFDVHRGAALPSARRRRKKGRRASTDSSPRSNRH